MTGFVMVNGPADLAGLEIVSRETLARISTVMAVLDEQRTQMNLIGPKEWPQIWQRHVWDCAQLFPLIDKDARVLDLGSGAGFPGLVIACELTASGQGDVTMIESTGKKCLFLRDAIRKADLRARVIQGRVENTEPFPVDIVTARAFAPLPKLLDRAAPWLENGATGLFHKGEHWQEELTKASERWSFAYEAIPSQSGGSGIILKVSEVRHVS